jgi:hypothetical protein
MEIEVDGSGWKKKKRTREESTFVRASMRSYRRACLLCGRLPRLISGLEHEREEVLDETGVRRTVDCSQYIQHLLIRKRHLYLVNRQYLDIRVSALLLIFLSLVVGKKETFPTAFFTSVRDVHGHEYLPVGLERANL